MPGRPQMTRLTITTNASYRAVTNSVAMRETIVRGPRRFASVPLELTSELTIMRSPCRGGFPVENDVGLV